MLLKSLKVKKKKSTFVFSLSCNRCFPVPPLCSLMHAWLVCCLLWRDKPSTGAPGSQAALSRYFPHGNRVQVPWRRTMARPGPCLAGWVRGCPLPLAPGHHFQIPRCCLVERPRPRGLLIHHTALRNPPQELFRKAQRAHAYWHARASGIFAAGRCPCMERARFRSRVHVPLYNAHACRVRVCFDVF